MDKLFGVMAGVYGFLGVLLGAFAAHALKDKLSSYAMSIMETAVRYQMYHALALLAVAIALKFSHHTLFNAAGVCFFIGILLFSGSLYLIALTDMKVGIVTPIGGFLLLLGWLLFSLGIYFS